MAKAVGYKKTYIKKIDLYLKKKRDKIIKRIKSDGEKSTSWQYEWNVELPSIEDFAKFIKIARSTVYEWEKSHEEFAEALDKIRAEQFLKLVSGGLSGKYNPIISKLLLGMHGVREKIDATTDDKPINTFTDDQIDRIAKRITSGK